MSSANTDSKKSPKTSSRAGWVHFGIAAGFLLVMSIGWPVIKSALGVIVRKEPIPWPEKVTIDKLSFQNTSLPDSFGPYKLYEEREHKADVLETLKIGTTLDSQRYKKHLSNWYLTRVYEDTREAKNSQYRYWVLDIVFYNGGETTVPHVPDICAVSGGARLTGEEFIEITCPDAPSPWNEKFSFKALYYERAEYAGRFEQAQYYLFDVNGEPEVSRDMVRLTLTSLALRHIFYAKIQFYIPAPIRDRKKANAKAKEFLEACMPAVLKEFPTKADIDMLSKKKASATKKDK